MPITSIVSSFFHPFTVSVDDFEYFFQFITNYLFMREIFLFHPFMIRMEINKSGMKSFE